ncbi:DUF4760 domain-containing protein [Pseudoflavitalea sp. X16]|nr:DUF4760 domain-containing protein [Paraflavitalea devenefica]
MCSFGSVTIGLIYNAIALQYNAQINKLRFEKEDEVNNYNKKRLTYEIMSDWYKADMAMNAEKARRFVTPFKGKLNDPVVLSEFKKKLADDAHLEDRKSLTAVLNYFENLALLVYDKVIDEAILKKAFRTAFLTYYNNLKEYIEDEQRGNNGSNCRIFINFVSLSKSWLWVD